MSLFSGLRDKLSALKPDKPAKDEMSSKLSNVAFTSCHDAVIRSYTVNPPSLNTTLTGSDRAVYAVHISPYAPHLLLSGGYDCMVRVWDLRTNTQTMVLDGHKDSIFCLVMLPDGRVVSGSSDKTIRVWNLKSKKCEFSLNAHFGGILSLVHINVGTGYLASCGIDHTVRLWSLQAKSCCCTMQGHSLPVASLALIDDTSMLSAGHDGEIKRWRLHLPTPNGSAATRKADLEMSIKAHEKSIHVLCLLPEGRLASAGRDCSIKIWNLSTLHTGVAIMTLNGHTKDINGLAWTGERRLVSGGSDCTVRVWNIDRPAVNGSYCDQTITSQSAAGAPTVVYAVFAYRSLEELSSTNTLPPASGMKRSSSKNVIAGGSAQSAANSPQLIAAGAVPPAPQGSQPVGAPSMTDSQGQLRSKGRTRVKPEANQAALLEAKRLEKQRKAREQEKLRVLEQSRLLEEEVDDEETKRFTSILSLPSDNELPPETLSRVRKYRNAHHLNYHDILKNGWYDDGGLIPGVNAAKVGKERGGVGRWEYDVIVFDSAKDPLLADVIDTAKRLVRQQDSVKGRVQILAQLVSNKLGGLPNDIIGAWERVRQKAMKHRAVRQAQMSLEEQAKFDSRTIVPIGALIGETGLTRHRACLFKYLCDLTVQNPEEWCYPVDSDGALSPHNGEEYRGSVPSSPAQSDAPVNSFGTSDDRDVAMPLNRFLDDQNSTATMITDELDRPRLRLTRRTSGDSDSSEKDPPLIRAGRSVLSPDELAIHCRLIRGQYQYYVPRSRKNRDNVPTLNSPSANSLPSPSSQSPQSPLDDKNEDERGRERIGGYHAWNVVIINGEHYVVDLIYEPSILYHESSREALHYNRGRRGTPKQTGLTNLPVRDVREIDYSEFTNIQTLKDGGFGRVERARWGKLDVVIKTPLTTDTYVIKTFIEEARVLNTLNHPNIVQLIGVCSSKKAIILEYINGSDVHQWIRQHRPPSNPHIVPTQPLITLKERLDVLIQSALAMQYLHGCEPPIVHRDLKTLNLLINNVGNHRVIKVCDFGLARNQKNNDGISTQHKDMGTPCLPEHDTRILTNHGFLFLSEVERQIATCNDVLYACFDVAKQAIVYKPGKIVLSPSPHRWVEFTQSSSRSHWDSSSSDYGAAVADTQANHLSLRVTPSHRMYVQPGSSLPTNHPLSSSVLAASSPLNPLKLPAVELAPGYHCHCSVVHDDACPHNYNAYMMFTAAVNGVMNHETLSDMSSPIAGLRIEKHIDAFFSLYGHWLATSSIDYTNKGLVIRVDDSASRASVVNSLKVLDLQEESDWRFHNDAVLITSPRWFQYFDDEYGPQLRKLDDTSSSCSLFPWLLTQSSPSQLRILLHALHQATATQLSTTSSDSKCIITSSVQFREDLLRVCLHAGYSARFAYVDGMWHVIYDERNTATMLASDVRYDGALFQSRCGEIQTTTELADGYDFERDGRVWCVEVEHSDSLIIVQRAHRNSENVVTKVGSSMVIGNCFQSPEQWRDDDEERLTEKTDVYSFGGILLEVLTDRIPWFEEKSKYAIYQHVVVEKRGPPIPPVIAFTVPPMLIDLIRWCQAHEPEKRPSFPEILRVLREVDDSLPPD